MAATEPYVVSTDPRRLDIEMIHRFLCEESYWARGIPRRLVEKCIRHSLCFGAYLGERQVGFARAVTDYAVFAHLMDVFVLPEHRGRGISKQLMAAIVGHPDLQGLRRWQLGTLDAHGLYAQFGFRPLGKPEIHMEIADPDVYMRGARS